MADQADGQKKFPALHPSESSAVQMFGWRLRQTDRLQPMICVGNHLRDGLMTGGENQADGFRQGNTLLVLSQWAVLRLHEHLGLKGIRNSIRREKLSSARPMLNTRY